MAYKAPTRSNVALDARRCQRLLCHVYVAGCNGATVAAGSPCRLRLNLSRLVHDRSGCNFVMLLPDCTTAPCLLLSLCPDGCACIAVLRTYGCVKLLREHAFMCRKLLDATSVRCQRARWYPRAFTLAETAGSNGGPTYAGDNAGAIVCTTPAGSHTAWTGLTGPRPHEARTPGVGGNNCATL